MKQNAFSIRFGLGLVVLYSWLLISCSPQLAQAQAQAKNRPDDIAALSEQYNLAIANCVDAEPCGYFVNQVTLNQRSHPWPVVGTYVSTRSFWYRAAQTEEASRYTLGKVLIETRRSNRLEKEEYFFDDKGQLLCYAFKMGEQGEAFQDLQFFFDQNVLLAFRESVSDAEKAYQRWNKGDAAVILKQAQAMREQFAGMMAE